MTSNVNHTVVWSVGVHLTSPTGNCGWAVYERTADICAPVEYGAIADDTVKWSTDNGPYVFITSRLAVGMSTAEFMESEIKVESDCPTIVTTVTWDETIEAVEGCTEVVVSLSCYVFYMAEDSAVDRDCVHLCE